MKANEKIIDGLKVRFNALYKDAATHINRAANGGPLNELNMASISIATAQGMMFTLAEVAGNNPEMKEITNKMMVYLTRLDEMMDAAKNKIMSRDAANMDSMR